MAASIRTPTCLLDCGRLLRPAEAKADSLTLGCEDRANTFEGEIMQGDLLITLLKDGDERILQFNNSADSTFCITKLAYLHLMRQLIKFEFSDANSSHILLDAIDYESEDNMRLELLQAMVQKLGGQDEEV